MIATLWLLAALNAPAKAAVDIDRSAITHVVTERHPSSHVDDIVLQGNYALAHGRSPAGPIYEGLELMRSGWRVVCSFKVAPTSSELASSCGFPAGIASAVASSQTAQALAERGEFERALTLEKRAYASVTGPARDTERARVQFLTMLNDRMRLGLVTRQQAILQWNEFRYSWALP